PVVRGGRTRRTTHRRAAGGPASRPDRGVHRRMSEGTTLTDPVRDVVVLGSGVAGLSAAVYAARADLEPLVLEGPEPGGQLTLTTDVENYLGFPEGVGGMELIQRGAEQAERFGAEFAHGTVEDATLAERPF